MWISFLTVQVRKKETTSLADVVSGILHSTAGQRHAGWDLGFVFSAFVLTPVTDTSADMFQQTYQNISNA